VPHFHFLEEGIVVGVMDNLNNTIPMAEEEHGVGLERIGPSCQSEMNRSQYPAKISQRIMYRYCDRPMIRNITNSVR
jgi:hypothetical protein